MYTSQNDGNALFSGGGFMPSQSTQLADTGHSPAKNRGTQGVFPLTVKQISEASQSGDEKSSFFVDGVDVTNVRLLGLVMNKMSRVTDATFTLDDGTGRMEVQRWVHETSDTNEMATIQNGMYVTVNGHLKAFQGKLRVTAFSIRPVTDFDEIALHFIDCIHVHLVNTRGQVQGRESSLPPNSGMNTTYQNEVKKYQTPTSNQFPSHTNTPKSGNINDLVLGVFQEPANLVGEHGVHIEEVARQLGLPLNKISTAIEFLVNDGLIYSTIDDYHFKSTCNG